MPSFVRFTDRFRPTHPAAGHTSPTRPPRTATAWSARITDQTSPYGKQAEIFVRVVISMLTVAFGVGCLTGN